jgi:alanyl aminopeptidase
MLRAGLIAFLLLAIAACGPSVVPTHLDESHVTRGGAPATPPTVPPGPEAAPTLRLGNEVIPRHATLELDLDPRADHFTGRIQLDVSLARPLATVWLHGRDLEIEQAVAIIGGTRSPLTARFQDPGLLALDAAQQLPAGQARLDLAYRGHMDLVNLDGIFLNEDRGERYLFTQFETSDARRAFPCFDEPRFKIPWSITLHVPAGLTVVGNTAVRAEELAADGKTKAVELATTRPLPSYLVAFAVGPFDVVEAGQTSHGAKMRIVVPRGRSADAAYAVAHTAPLLDALEAYLGLPYPYPKLDLVAVPDFAPGAMENPGLITFKASRLLIRKADQSLAKVKAFTTTTAHELAHQWFGDSVTPAWWDDVWLNESFATWLETKIVDGLHPDWEVAGAAAASTVKVMGADSLDSARRVRQPIRGNDDLADAFDTISYAKGAAILRMLERALGDRVLQQALHAYLLEHADGVASYDDFVQSVEAAAGREVRPLLSTFVEQTGVPYVTVEWTQPDTWTLRQSRLPRLGEPPPPPRTWIVPVCPRYGMPGPAGPPPCVWLDTKPVVLGVPMPMTWSFMNAGAAGYYHADLLDWRLALAHGQLSAAERVWMIGEAGFQHGAGVLPTKDLLAMMVTLADDPSEPVMEQVIQIGASLEHRGMPEAVRTHARALVRMAFGPRARKLGWTPRKGDDDRTIALRPRLLQLVTIGGRDKTLGAEARRLAERWIADPHAIAPDIVDAVLASAVVLGDSRFRSRLLAAGDALPDHEERRRIYTALATTRDPLQARANLALLLDERRPIRDELALLWGAAANLDDGGRLAWDFVVSNWPALVARLPRDFPGLLPRVIAYGCSSDLTDEGRAFFADKIAAFEGGRVVLARALESAVRCVTTHTLLDAAVERAILAAPLRPPGGSPARRP